jgi:hypothetical protein
LFRDGKSEDEDEDEEDYDGCNGDSGDFTSLENSGKTSPSSGEYYVIVAVHMCTLEFACNVLYDLNHPQKYRMFQQEWNVH